MTQTNIIDLLIIACSGLLVWSIAATLTIWSERKELTDLRESMSKTNYYLHQQLERVKDENEALRTQNHQLRKGRNEQN